MPNVQPKSASTHKSEQAHSEFSLGAEHVRNNHSTEISESDARSFFKRFAQVAISERKKFGVPSSILLATAFLNSHAGLNDMAIGSNNFFLIRCSEEWEGDTYAADGLCIKKYESAWEGWRDFSIHLSGQTWFGALKKAAGKDWLKWSKGMQGKDVSNIQGYNQKMIEVINYYRLDQFDKM
ncbi:MAG: glucosaminidase domain-containing protein [Saprospiraceae bacterium]|nr:glucosaminidase domain-containing protein [Saprospiraceae bacterium]